MFPSKGHNDNVAEGWAFSMNTNKNERHFIYFSHHCDQISEGSCSKKSSFWLTVSGAVSLLWYGTHRFRPPAYLSESSRRLRQGLEAKLSFNVTTNDALC